MNMKWIRIVGALLACCCMWCLMACNSSQPGGDSLVTENSSATEGGSSMVNDVSSVQDSAVASSDAAVSQEGGSAVKDSSVSSTMAGSAPAASSTAQVDVKDAQVVFTAGQVSAKAGETVVLPIIVSENSQVAATDVYVRFDSTQVSYVKYNQGKTFSPTMQAGNLEAEGRFHYTMATVTPFTKSGEMFTVSFKVAEGITGTIPISLEVPTLVDEKIEPLTCAVVDGSITVK